MQELPQLEEEKVDLHVSHTSCKDCVFAIYDKNTQTGCKLNRIERYKNQGTSILEAYDDEKEFFIINGRPCVANRDKNSEWAKIFEEKEYESRVRKELTIRLDVLVLFLNGNTIQDLEKTLSSLKLMPLKPLSVTVVNNQDKVHIGLIQASLLKNAGELSWRITDIVEKDMDNNRPPVNRCIDIASKNLKGHFYSLLQAGNTLPETFTLDLDKAVVDNMGRFVVIFTNKDGYFGQCVSLGFHNASMVNGNNPFVNQDTNEILSSVFDKAAYLVESENLPHLIEHMENVCPQASQQ